MSGEGEQLLMSGSTAKQQQQFEVQAGFMKLLKPLASQGCRVGQAEVELEMGEVGGQVL